MTLVTIHTMTLFDNILVWIHLTASTFWVGGMLFLSLVAVPLLKKVSDPASAQRDFVNLAKQFRLLVWGALSLLIVTGTLLLSNHVDLSESPGNWPPALLVKLTLVLLLILVSVVHDQIIGPRVRRLKRKPTCELVVLEKLLLGISPMIGKLTMLLGLAILLAAVFLVRM